MSDKKFFGKYRGTVSDINDLMMLGRIKAKVPDVLGDQESSWAMPCAPFGGSSTGFFALPTVNAGVWIEFEQGDSDYPIWTGGFWGSAGEVPDSAATPAAIPPGQNILLQTTGRHMMMVSDAPPSPAGGGIVLKSAGGAMIVVNETGIYVSNGQGAAITLVGPVVDINNGGLTVT